MGKAFPRLMLYGFSTLLLAAICRGADGAPIYSAPQLFEIAKNFYGPTESRKPLPPAAVGGLHCLLKAAEANYPPALYNTFMAHRFGYFGVQDLRAAAVYRGRWLETVGTPTAFYELGLGQLGVWSPLAKPGERSATLENDFIFTGAMADQNRQRVARAEFDLASIDQTYPVDLALAARAFARSVEKGIESPLSLSPEDRTAVERSLKVLTSLTLGDPSDYGRSQYTFF